MKLIIAEATPLIEKCIMKFLKHYEIYYVGQLINIINFVQDNT